MKKRLTSNKLRRMVLQEFKNLGMVPMGAISSHHGAKHHMGYDDHELGEDVLMPHHDEVGASGRRHHEKMGHEDKLSKEDCCIAVMAIANTCSCPMTREKIIDLCDSLLSGDHHM